MGFPHYGRPPGRRRALPARVRKMRAGVYGRPRKGVNEPHDREWDALEGGFAGRDGGRLAAGPDAACSVIDGWGRGEEVLAGSRGGIPAGDAAPRTGNPRARVTR